jgi:prevent-host-death family protein
MSTISANELKTRGASIIEATLANQPEAVISVRGKDRFVVMDIEHYNYLRECELTAAIHETQEDIKAGRVVHEPITKHIKRLKSAL